MSTSSVGSTPKSNRNTRSIKPNPKYNVQPGIQSTQNERDRLASTSSTPSSPAPYSTPKAAAQSAVREWENRFTQLEKRLGAVEEDRRRLREEVKQLRDRLEEVEWAKERLENKVKENEHLEERTEKIIMEVEKESSKRKEREKEIMEVEKEERKKEIKEVEERLAAKIEEVSASTGKQEQVDGGVSAGAQRGAKTYRCIVFTDSNGRDVTTHSIRNHMPHSEREKYEIDVHVAFRVEDALYRVTRGEIDVSGCYVVIDNMTNNVRGGRRQADTPEQLVHRINELRTALLSSSAAAVVVVQVKPMRHIDVRPYNWLLHSYLTKCGQTGYGSKTLIRMEHLQLDGYHINPLFDAFLDRTYAYALLGKEVPCPTPTDNFMPEFVRHRWNEDFPRLVGQGWNRGP